MHAGLTSRPVVGRGSQAREASPYTLLNQARLALQLPQVLGLSKVLYAGHGDGALLAVMASGLALRCAVMLAELLCWMNIESVPPLQTEILRPFVCIVVMPGFRGT